MEYALSTLWHERQRYLPGVLAVAFSALLIALQCGLLMGLFSITSMPIDHTHADLWVGAPGVLSVDLGESIREGFLARVAAQPEIAHCESYFQGFAYWTKREGGRELCMVIGSRLGDGALGHIDELTPELREKLTEPGAIVIDESDRGRLGVRGVGDVAEVTGRRVKVVGMTRGLKSLAGPYVFCSIATAQPMLRYPPGQITYVLAKCHNPADAPKVVERLRGEFTNMSAFTSGDFSVRSQVHWLTKTKAGIALGYAAALGLLVGAVVTSQTLYAATAASLREFAVLRALGIPRWRMGALVLAQSFWVGVLGVALSLPAAYVFGWGADELGVRVLLKPWLLASATAVTLTMAVLSGLLALRSLRLVEPATLLR
jgi:putative ABC transport system permease protein